ICGSIALLELVCAGLAYLHDGPIKIGNIEDRLQVLVASALDVERCDTVAHHLVDREDRCLYQEGKHRMLEGAMMSLTPQELDKALAALPSINTQCADACTAHNASVTRHAVDRSDRHVTSELNVCHCSASSSARRAASTASASDG